MIKVGKARLYQQIVGEYETITSEIFLNVVEKTSGDSYREIFVNRESWHYTDGYMDSTETSDTYDVYVGITVEQACMKYRMAGETLSWITALTEV